MSPASFVCAHASHHDWHVALAECQSRIQGQIAALAVQSGRNVDYTLGWCYLTDHYAPAAEAILEALHRHLPGIEWVGTVGIGVSASGVEYIDEPAVVLMAAPLPRGSFRLFSGLQPLPAPGSEFTPHTALVHAEATTPDVQELLQELAERTATGYLFGGLASARNRTLHLADNVFTGGLSGVAFGPEVGLISRVTQGCQPIGPARTITQGEQDLVVSLDGRPALACVLEDLGVEADLPDEELAEVLSGTLVGLSTGAEDIASTPGKFGPDTMVRHLVGVDPQAQILAIGDNIEPGTQLTFCRRDPEAARADLLRIAKEVRAELEDGAHGQLAGALYVSCSGRGGPHFGGRDAELQTLRSVLGDVPLAGFFAGGEIARDHLYGYTGVLTVFTAPG